jgi:hypothetical protein
MLLRVKALKITTLLAAVIAFDLFVIWAVVFTVSWSGGFLPLSAVGFCLFAGSPLIATAYGAHKLRSFCRGEDPPV